MLKRMILAKRKKENIMFCIFWRENKLKGP